MPRKREVIDGEIQCSGCSEWKAFTTNNFYQRSNGVMEVKCKDCQVSESRQYRETHEKTEEQKQRQRAITKQWYVDNREIVSAKEKEKRAEARSKKPTNVKDGMRRCTDCGEWKENTEANFSITKGKTISKCKPCNAQRSREYKKNHPLTEEQRQQQSVVNKQWRKQNRSKVRANMKQWKSNNRLRVLISDTIRRALLREGSSKEGQSIFNHLPYTLEELIAHLETLFEPWMTWDNWGQYKPSTWNNNDQSTWTWQIDHIIPQVAFPYSSMTDANFQKCWALDNLRPLSAKQNVQDGDRGWRKSKAIKKEEGVEGHNAVLLMMTPTQRID